MTVLGQRTFDDLGAPLAEVPFCVLDLETTGLTPDQCEITEIGAIRFAGGIETGRFHTLVNPRAPIPPTVTVVTGITQAMVIDAPLIEEALPSFLEFLGSSVIVGHNVRFDIAFLDAASLRLGYGRLPNRSTDTLRLARRLASGEIRNFRLHSLAAHFGSPTMPNHRAFDDALATAHVFWSLLERAGSIGVTHLDDLLALPTIKGSRAIGKLSLTERLPRGPGVYIFRDRSGTAIYIGKASDLRSRVRSYFAGDHRRQVDAMLRDLARIDHIGTTCELEAAVLELRMIDRQRPRYNTRSKPPKALYWVTITDERFPRLSLTRSADRGLMHIGPFRSRRQAETVMHALWDASPIRRCTRPGRGCEYAQLGVCVCPCDGSITEERYALIVSDLIAALRSDSRRLLEPVRSRMQSLAAHRRYEEAARCRDGWDQLSRALRRQRQREALERAGSIVASAQGVTIMVEEGRLSGAWAARPTSVMVGNIERPDISAAAAADEAALLWRWLTDGATEIVSVSEGISIAPDPIPPLHPLDHALSGTSF